MLAGIARAGSNEYLTTETVRRARAEMLVRLERNEEAIAAYSDLREVGGRELEAECDLAIGKLQQEAGRYRESVPSPGGRCRAWRKRLRPTALYYLGLAHTRLGEGDKAVVLLKEYLKLRPDSVAGYRALADALEGLGKSNEAEAMYIAAVRRFPDNPAAYRKAIDHLSRHGKVRDALAYAEGLEKVDPDHRRTEELLRRLRSMQDAAVP